jgi:hypothetical protein
MSGDFDPRDCDSRERDDGIRDREDEWLVLGRGPGSPEGRDDAVEHDTRDRDEDWREDRDRDSRDRDEERGGLDPRDVFMRDLDLPDGRGRDLVHDRDREYTLSGSDTRALSTIGAFRVVPERDLGDRRDAAFNERGDLQHLEKQGLSSVCRSTVGSVPPC